MRICTVTGNKEKGVKIMPREYEIVLGRKNVAVKLIITFDKKDCFHLMGLQDYIYYTTD